MIISGTNLKVLRRWFQQESTRFAKASPILILEGSSSANHRHGDDASSSSDPNTMAARHVHLWLAQHLGLRTVVSQGASGGRWNHRHNNEVTTTKSSGGGSGSMFYTEPVLQEQMELAGRIGAGTICAVGDRNAMDLAKAMTIMTQQQQQHDSLSSSSTLQELVLVPNTYEAVLSCAALDHAIFLHSQQDVLLVSSRRQPQDSSFSSPNTTILSLPSNLFEEERNQPDESPLSLLRQMQIALQACAALAWHSPKQQDQEQTDGNSLSLLELVSEVSHAIKELEDDKESLSIDTAQVETWHQATNQYLLAMGQAHLNFGIAHGDVRSIPLAVAVGLLPTVFADQDLLSIMASCCPPDALGNQSTLSSSLSLLTTEPVDTLLSHVQNSQMEWNCADAPATKLRSVLEQYTLLP